MSIFSIRVGVQEGNSASEITKKSSFAHWMARFGFSPVLNTSSGAVLYHGLGEIVGLGDSSTTEKTFYAATHRVYYLSRGPSDPPSSTSLLLIHCHP